MTAPDLAVNTSRRSDGASHETIYALIPKVMKSIGAVTKDRTNIQQNFKFRGIDDAMNAVQPALVEHGVFYMPTVVESAYETYQTSKGTTMRSCTLTVDYVFYGPLGDSVTMRYMGESADAGDKSTSKAESMALKYGLLHALCIPTEESDDGDQTTHERATPTRPKPIDRAKFLSAVTAAGLTEQAVCEDASRGKRFAVDQFDDDEGDVLRAAFARLKDAAEGTITSPPGGAGGPTSPGAANLEEVES